MLLRRPLGVALQAPDLPKVNRNTRVLSTHAGDCVQIPFAEDVVVWWGRFVEELDADDVDQRG